MLEQPSRRTTDTVRATVPFLTGEACTELLEGELVYDPSDPYAVAMHLEARLGTVIWSFARDLLVEGIYSPIGNGDVQVWPCLSSAGEAVVIIELCSPDGLALLQAPSRVVRDFLDQTLARVPAGEESVHLSMDFLISRLLSD